MQEIHRRTGDRRYCAGFHSWLMAGTAAKPAFILPPIVHMQLPAASQHNDKLPGQQHDPNKSTLLLSSRQ